MIQRTVSSLNDLEGAKKSCFPALFTISRVPALGVLQQTSGEWFRQGANGEFHKT